MTTPHAIGVDLSYTATGIAWPEAVDTFGTSPDDGDDIVRAQLIRNHVAAHARDARLVMIEGGVNRSHAAFRSGVLHGVVRSGLAETVDPSRVHLVPPATLKRYATGKGNAAKVDMIVAARERLGYDGTDDNEADALWLRAAGQHLLGRPLVKLPKSHVEALDVLMEVVA